MNVQPSSRDRWIARAAAIGAHALFIALLVLGVWKWLQRKKPQEAPGWMSAIESAGPGRAFGLALLDRPGRMVPIRGPPFNPSRPGLARRGPAGIEAPPPGASASHQKQVSRTGSRD